MNKQEAYSILNLSPGASPEDIKKQYKKLSFEFHPDRNKDLSAVDSFKKVKEANDLLSKKNNPSLSPFSNDTFNPFGRHIRVPDHINLYTTISFQESIFGTKKDLKFNRQIKCKSCNGDGQINLNNGCDKCKGKGVIVVRHGNTIVSQTCDKCYGQTQTEECNTCSSEGSLNTEISVQINIPGGVVSGNILRLSGMGNYAGSFLGMDQVTDAHLNITVNSDPDFKIDGKDVTFKLELSLLEALQGCKKTVKTVSGEKEIDINPSSRNLEEIIIPNLGVNKIGSQRVILDVKYPEDIEKLIATLKVSAMI